MIVGKKQYRASWLDGHTVKMIDQPKLPWKFSIASFKNHKETARAIKTMVVRGAGSIGAAAAFGAAQVVLEAKEKNYSKYCSDGFTTLKKTRPTAQDLFWAVNRIEKAIGGKNLEKAREAAVREANRIGDEYAERGKNIGEHGSKLLKNDSKLLTHCNAGWLALHDWGSALSPVYAAKRQGKKVFVFVDETRPRLQGARLTAWELANEGIDHRVIADNAAGYFMQNGEIDLCIVGADRVAANGDIANKIGTYEKAVVAKENGVPFYAAVPTSTIDLGCKTGKDIPIEERSEIEVLNFVGKRITPKKSRAFNPAFDTTPAKYITGLITENGIIGAKRKDIGRLF